MRIEAIKQSELPQPLNNPTLLEDAISFINGRLYSRSWHDQHHPVKGYNAIILSPAGKYESVMDEAVHIFQKEGWDCYWSPAYDGRGPHHCFYIHKSHFE